MPTEYILAYHCAPAFAGIKPSNIASCSKRENPNITVQIKMLNEKLNKTTQTKICFILFPPKCYGYLLL